MMLRELGKYLMKLIDLERNVLSLKEGFILFESIFYKAK